MKARILLASTSEVYGDPEIHPQPETYWGHVNPIGPRACYDEGKRVAETLMYAYAKQVSPYPSVIASYNTCTLSLRQTPTACICLSFQERVDIRIARIFNTFGPRMHMNDGRVVSNFILQALQNENITVRKGGKVRFQRLSKSVAESVRFRFTGMGNRRDRSSTRLIWSTAWSP